MKRWILTLLIALLPFSAMAEEGIMYVPLGGPNWSAFLSSIIPGADNTYDLGASSYEWKDLYVDGTGHIDSVDADAVDVTGVTDGNIPYMQAAGAGFGDSPLSRTDADTLTFQSTTGKAAILNLYSDAAEDNSDKWRVQVADGGNVTLESYATGAWVAVATWTNAGALTMTGNVAGATYGSDGSISDAELLTLDNGATTEILVGGGAGSAPVWTTATGTGAPVRAGSPTFTTQITTPKVLGGTGTTQDLDLQTTSGVGTTGADMHFKVGNNGATEALTILNSGNIGIGTTAPGTLLDIVSSTQTNPRITNTSAGTTALASWIARNDTSVGYAQFGVGGTGYTTLSGLQDMAFVVAGPDISGINIYNEGTGPTIFTQNDIEKVRITTAGNVGIGTTAPATLLDQAKFSADAVGSYHTFSKSRHATVGSHTIVQDNDVIGGINFAPSDGTDFGTISAQIKSSVDDASPAASSIGGDLTFWTAAGAASDDLTQRMVIDKSGNVGIGTTSPGVALEVYRSGGGVESAIHINSAASTPVLRLQQGGVSKWSLVGEYPSAGLFSFYDNAAVNAAMVIKTGGSVGIGTTSPNTKLDQAQFSADAVGSYHTFSKSRNATAGSHTVVKDNDVIGGIKFAPSDGTDFGTISAQIAAEVDDASPAASSIGGALVFSTAAGAGADDLAERLRLDKNGGLWWTDGTDTSVVKHVQEAGLGGRLTIGLDETARTMVICDAGDVDTDFGLSAASNPQVRIFGADAATYMKLDYNSISTSGGFAVTNYSGNGYGFKQGIDRSTGSLFTFNSDADIELTDTDGEQSWVYIEPKINQSATAAYNGLQIKVTETALGDGSTGTGATNNLIVAGTSADSDKFKVTNNGSIVQTTGNTVWSSETVTCASDAGTATVTTATSFIVTDGGADTNEDTVSLADGVAGQIKYFVYMTETDVGDTANVTPATALGFTKIVFDTPGEGCTMIYTASGWAIISNNGGTVS